MAKSKVWRSPCGTVELYHGDCLKVLRRLHKRRGQFIATIISDPPYGLSFMGREWDRGVPGKQFWKLFRKCMIPGGMCLAFGGTRTYHRLAVAIEDSGFELRDCLMWLYGQGFPKGDNISKKITRLDRTTLAEAALWDGWNSGLKPSWEPILLSMNPKEGTFASNALEHGVAGLNIDAARVERETIERTGPVSFGSTGPVSFGSTGPALGGGDGKFTKWQNTKGGWPTNVVIDERVAAALDDEYGIHSTGTKQAGRYTEHNSLSTGTWKGRIRPLLQGSSGGVSRYFYTAKADKREKEAGLGGLELQTREDVTGRKVGSAGTDHPRAGSRRKGGFANTHPTVKPLSLMRWLVRLTSHPSPTAALDPFMGSGTTGVACAIEGRPFIGIELSLESFEIAKRRIAHALRGVGQEVEHPTGEEPIGQQDFWGRQA